MFLILKYNLLFFYFNHFCFLIHLIHLTHYKLRIIDLIFTIPVLELKY